MRSLRACLFVLIIAGAGLVGLGSPAGAVPVTQCNDGKDNDANGVVDYPNDLGCSSPTDTTEKAPVTCTTVKGIHGTSRANVLKGSAKVDKFYGDGGDDTITGVGGNDCLYGGTGRDGISGGTGNDLVSAGTGVDTVHGNEGNDVLYGGADDDTVYGDDGNDLINPGGGLDTVYGGAGNDRIVTTGTGRDVVDCGAGTDVAIVDKFDSVTGCETVIVLPAVPATLSATTPAAFDPTVTGSTSATRTVTVTNSGTQASGVPTVALAGADADQFVLSANTCTTAVAAGGSCTVDVAFAPTTAGPKAANLTATASPGGQASVGLSGTAVLASYSIDPTSHDFGSTAVGATTYQTFVVTNHTGTDAGMGGDVGLSSVFSFDFGGDFTCLGGLPANGTCTVTVAFAPGEPGAANATMLLYVGAETLQTSLTGTGIAPENLRSPSARGSVAPSGNGGSSFGTVR